MGMNLFKWVVIGQVLDERIVVGHAADLVLQVLEVERGCSGEKTVERLQCHWKPLEQPGPHRPLSPSFLTSVTLHAVAEPAPFSLNANGFLAGIELSTRRLHSHHSPRNSTEYFWLFQGPFSLSSHTKGLTWFRMLFRHPWSTLTTRCKPAAIFHRKAQPRKLLYDSWPKEYAESWEYYNYGGKRIGFLITIINKCYKIILGLSLKESAREDSTGTNAQRHS